MVEIKPHKFKYHQFYWDITLAAAEQSVAKRSQVGALVVTPEGMLSTGWNGMPPGFPNDCEIRTVNENGIERPKTNPEVIHAEHNAISKMLNSGIATKGSILFVTMAPCVECAKWIITSGIKKVYYMYSYKTAYGLDMLRAAGIEVYKYMSDSHYELHPLTKYNPENSKENPYQRYLGKNQND